MVIMKTNSSGCSPAQNAPAEAKGVLASTQAELTEVSTGPVNDHSKAQTQSWKRSETRRLESAPSRGESADVRCINAVADGTGGPLTVRSNDVTAVPTGNPRISEGVLFEYSQIGADLARELKVRAERIRGGLARHTIEIIRVGSELRAAKQKLPHGMFLAWVESEIGLSRRAAQLYMRAFEWVANKDERFARLPVSIIYLLAAQTTPHEIVNDFVRRVEMGHSVTYSTLRERIESERRTRRNVNPGDRSEAEKSFAITTINPAGVIKQREVARTATRELVNMLRCFLTQNEFNQIREVVLRAELGEARWRFGDELIEALSENRLSDGCSSNGITDRSAQT